MLNPILVFLLFLAGFLLWLLCSALFQPIGRLFGRLIDDAKKAMIDEKENEKE